MNKKYLFLIIIIILVSACSKTPDEGAIQTVIAQTMAVQPTPTQTFTIVPSSTFTPTLTNTPTPTNSPTPTKTNTPTPTNTFTPIPPATLTQIAKEATQTQNSFFVTATREQYNKNSTATQNAKNEFATATSYYRTATAQVRNATATEMASYTTIYWKELATYPENYIGTKVKVSGRIFNIIGSVIQMYFAGTYEALYVNLREPASGVYEDNSITVYGVVKGYECFTNTMGNQICQPALKNAWFTKP